MTTRRFLISASLARLLRLHLGSTRGAHGYFPPQPDRIHFIDLEPGRWEMVIVPVENDSHGPEERLAITRRHAEALLDLCAAKLCYEQTWVLIDDGREVRLDHFIAGSGTVDVLTLE